MMTDIERNSLLITRCRFPSISQNSYIDRANDFLECKFINVFVVQKSSTFLHMNKSSTADVKFRVIYVQSPPHIVTVRGTMVLVVH